MDTKSQETALLLPVHSISKLTKVLALSDAKNFGELSEELLDSYIKIKSHQPVAAGDMIGESADSDTPSEETWSYSWKKNEVMHAVTVRTTHKGYEVLAGSDYELEATPSLYLGYVKMRNLLEEQGVVKNGKFVRDYTFKSTSAAASVARGMQLNGPKVFA